MSLLKFALVVIVGFVALSVVVGAAAAWLERH